MTVMKLTVIILVEIVMKSTVNILVEIKQFFSKQIVKKLTVNIFV